MGAAMTTRGGLKAPQMGGQIAPMGQPQGLGMFAQGHPGMAQQIGSNIGPAGLSATGAMPGNYQPMPYNVNGGSNIAAYNAPNVMMPPRPADQGQSFGPPQQPNGLMPLARDLSLQKQQAMNQMSSQPNNLMAMMAQQQAMNQGQGAVHPAVKAQQLARALSGMTQ